MPSLKNAIVELMKRTVVFTSMPVWLVVALTLLMVPRTLLSDLGLITEGTLLYYFFALLPFVIWLAVAVLRPAKKPFMDFLVLGILYGLTLAVVHQLLWNVSASIGHHPPQAALELGAAVNPALQELVVRWYTVAVSLLIGTGSGAAIGLVAATARFVRLRWFSKQSRR